MLDELNRHLTDLMETIASFRFDHDTASAGSTTDGIRAVEKRYLEIQSAAVHKIADLETLYDGLNHRCAPSTAPDAPSNTEIEMADKYLQNLYEFGFDVLPKHMRPFWLKAGDWFFRSEQWEDAVACWEYVLKSDPNNPFIHSRLDGFIRKALEGKDRFSSDVERQNAALPIP